MADPRRRHVSMIRSYTLADFFTIGNASCGTISIFLCLDYLATGNARFLWTVLGFTLGMRGGWDMLVLTYFVVCGVSRLARFNVTASALADETTGKVKYFEGTPIPTSIVLVIMLGIAQYLGRVDENLWFGVVKLGPALLHPLTLIYGLSGSAMISATLRIPKP
jgi:CDP-diacylglycerol--serine O-phosphatidyltransferase